jgi:hypothetical protein
MSKRPHAVLVLPERYKCVTLDGIMSVKLENYRLNLILRHIPRTLGKIHSAFFLLLFVKCLVSIFKEAAKTQT